MSSDGPRSRAAATGIALALAVAVAALAWFFWPVSQPEPAPTAPRARASATVERHAHEASWDEFPKTEAARAELFGRVRDGAGNPVADAEVRLYASETSSVAKNPCEPGEVDGIFEGLTCDAAIAVLEGLLDRGELEAEPVAATRTSADGAFRFAPPAGAYDLLAVAPGVVGALVGEETTGAEVELRVSPTAHGHGEVVGPDDAPVPNAEVLVARPRPFSAAVVRADAAGGFPIDGFALEEGVGVFVRAPGFLKHIDTVWFADGSGAMQADRPAPSDTSTSTPPVRLKLRRPARIFGRVVQGGAPVSGATVTLVDAQETATSGKDGHFAFEAVACDVCVLRAETPDALGELEVARNGEQEIAVELPLVAAARLVVEVRDAVTDAPIVDADLAVYSAETAATAQVRATAPGVYTVDRLAAGEYMLDAGAKGYVEAHDSVDAQPPTQTRVLRLARGLVLRGVVRSRAGQPVANAPLILEPGGDSVAPADGASGDDGRFELDGLVSGPYTLIVEHAAYAPAHLSVEVPFAGELEVVLGEGAALEVLAVDEKGAPVPNARVSATAQTADDDPHVETEMTDDLGVARLDHLPAGRFDVEARANNFRASQPVAVTLRDGGAERTRVVLERGAVVRGLVLGPNGRPVPRARVFCSNDLASSDDLFDHNGLGLRLADVLDADDRGRFELGGLEPRPYAFWAQGQGLTSAQPVVAEPGKEVVLKLEPLASVRGRVLHAGRPVTHFFVNDTEFRALDGRFSVIDQRPGTLHLYVQSDYAVVTREVTLVGGQVADVGDLEAAAVGAIAGVARRSGAPVAGIAVTAVPVGAEAGTAHAEDETERDGTFVLRNLAAGRYLVEAHDDANVGRAEVEVREGEAARVELSLERQDAVYGEVRDAAGRVVAEAEVTISALAASPGGVRLKTDRAGQFATTLPPGRYRAQAARGGALTSPADFEVGAGRATVALTLP